MRIWLFLSIIAASAYGQGNIYVTNDANHPVPIVINTPTPTPTPTP